MENLTFTDCMTAKTLRRKSLEQLEKEQQVREDLLEQGVKIEELGFL